MNPPNNFKTLCKLYIFFSISSRLLTNYENFESGLVLRVDLEFGNFLDTFLDIAGSHKPYYKCHKYSVKKNAQHFSFARFCIDAI